MLSRTRTVLTYVLMFPIVVGMLVLVTPIVAVKLPLFVCQRLRAVRLLMPLVIVYYPLIAMIGVFWLDLVWWEAIFLPAIGALACLLPDPWNFVLSSRKRRAVFAAIRYQEQLDQFRPLYDQVSVLKIEKSRCIISMSLESGTRPSHRKFVAVYHLDQCVEDLEYEYVAAIYDVWPLL